MTSQPREKNGRFAAKAGGPLRPRRKKVQPVQQAPVQVTPAPTGRKLVFAALVLDNSYSMRPIAHPARKAFNDILASFRSNASSVETQVSVILFGNSTRVLYSGHDPRYVPDIADYNPNENTALFDGVGRAIETLKAIPRSQADEVSYLVFVITDGEENHSTLWNARSINAQVAALQGSGGWTFAYQVPRGYKNSFVRSFGVSPDNVREWEQTDVGTREVSSSTTRGVDAYYKSVQASAAPVQVSSFFVQTDMSQVTAKQVHTKLDDLSDRFKSYEVKAEVQVKDFVEAKTKRPYVIGQAYYQLMKREKVQPSKAVLIVEKGKNAVWGGQQARNLIGLPAGADAKVTPGNHSNYDIFVQSTSVNRKLPRGTRVMIDVQQTVGLTPTWDHTAVPTP